MKKTFLISVILLITSISFAQTPYTNQVFKPEIKSVEFTNSKKILRSPLSNLTLASN